jgi:hypothetical protein
LNFGPGFIKICAYFSYPIKDLLIAERQVVVMPRHNDNRARAKGGRSRTIPTSAELMRLYADYLNIEYGALDSDYVFVNLRGRPHGHPLSYPAVYDLVGRLRRSTGITFGPHLAVEQALADWLTDRAPHVAGFLDAGLVFCDDGATIVNYARFESREDYQALSGDLAQDQWWQQRFAPLLEGEPRWIDGEWVPLPQ